MRRIAKNWRPSPLPLEFHLCLDEGRWENALRLYQAHPFSAPPVDTFELLKAIIAKTNASVEEIKRRLDEKLRISNNATRRDPEEIDWSLFWNSINNGDSRTISMALCGARIHGTQHQIGVAESCAILLQACGEQWHQKLVEEVPYSTVTRNNLLTIAWQQSRWDIACEMLQHIRIVKGEMLNLWPLIQKKNWEVALHFFLRCPKNAIAFDVVLPHLLESGCGLPILTQHLERAKILGDVEVIAPLLRHAAAEQDWAFVERCVVHLHDIGQISDSAFKLFKHMCESLTIAVVCERLQAADCELHRLTVEELEEVGAGSLTS